MTSASNFGNSHVASSDAGLQSPLPNLMVNPLDTEGTRRLNESARAFKSLAESGGFAVNEAGFQAYNKICNEFHDGYTGVQANFFRLCTRAKMGSSDYASQVADFNVRVANGDPQSLIPNLELLRKSIEQVQQALQIARNNYREADSEHAQTFSGIGKADS